MQVKVLVAELSLAQPSIKQDWPWLVVVEGATGSSSKSMLVYSISQGLERQFEATLSLKVIRVLTFHSKFIPLAEL